MIERVIRYIGCIDVTTLGADITAFTLKINKQNNRETKTGRIGEEVFEDCI
jgi:hypothetical protein